MWSQTWLLLLLYATASALLLVLWRGAIIKRWQQKREIFLVTPSLRCNCNSLKRITLKHVHQVTDILIILSFRLKIHRYLYCLSIKHLHTCAIVQPTKNKSKWNENLQLPLEQWHQDWRMSMSRRLDDLIQFFQPSVILLSLLVSPCLAEKRRGQQINVLGRKKLKTYVHFSTSYSQKHFPVRAERKRLLLTCLKIQVRYKRRLLEVVTFASCFVSAA